MRHKWNGKVRRSTNGYQVGDVVACLKCDCVKEIIAGKITYFINDCVYDKAPKCIIQ